MSLAIIQLPSLTLTTSYDGLLSTFLPVRLIVSPSIIIRRNVMLSVLTDVGPENFILKEQIE